MVAYPVPLQYIYVTRIYTPSLPTLDLLSCASLFTLFNNCPNASTPAVKADPSTCTPRAWSSSSRERAWITWQILEIAETASK